MSALYATAARKTAAKAAPPVMRKSAPPPRHAVPPLASLSAIPANAAVQRQCDDCEAEETKESAIQRRLAASAAAPAPQRACAACEEKEESVVQPRLEVGPAGDRHELEADSIAARVMAMPDPAAAAALAGDASPAGGELRARRDGGAETLAASDAELTSGGSALPASTRLFYETRMGRDLGGVRVHQGGQAGAMNASISARAFTYKNHVWLGAGESASPSFTMAHELAHVMQQTAPGPIAPRVQRAGMGEVQAAEAEKEQERLRQLEYSLGILPMLIKWREAGLLDPPARPTDVAAIPGMEFTPKRAEEVGTQMAGLPALARVATEVAKTAARAGPTLTLIEGGASAAAGAAGVAEGATVTGGAALGGGAAASVALPLAAGAIILLWSTPTAPAWMDTLNPITGRGYPNPEEYLWASKLDNNQRRYLQELWRRRAEKPDASLDSPPDVDAPALPVPKPKPKEDKKKPKCISMDVPRRGGHQRHDAYAVKVSGSTADFFAQTPGAPPVSINYDGRTPDTPSVWEVKVGHGWFHNPDYASLKNMTMARWDAQRARGLTVAKACGFLHLWSIPDKWIAGWLQQRWLGTPPVLNVPEK